MRKRYASVLTTKKQTNNKPYFNNQNCPNNTNCGYDTRRYGNKHYNNNYNKSYEQKSPITTSLVHMKLMRNNIMNERIKIFDVLIPPIRTPINCRNQVVIIIINNPARPTLSTG